MVTGLARSTSMMASSVSVKPQRVEDLIVPEHVAPRPAGLLNEDVCQANGFRAFVVVLGQNANAGRFGKIIEHRLGKLAVEGRIDDDLLSCRRPAAEKQNA